MKLWHYMVEFLSLCGALVFFALFFYQTTNNIYRINGTFADFSLAGWAAMLLVWGAGLWRYLKQQKVGGLVFAVQAAVVCCAFDCWRLFIYAAELKMKPYILCIAVAEAVVFLIAVFGRYKPAALNALAAGLIVFGGYYIVYPVLLPLPITMAIAVLLMLIYPLVTGTAKARKLAGGVWAVSLLLFAGVLFKFWLNAPGIHFYERGVEKPAREVKVSVVVPVYNAEKFLRRGLDSLRKQTLKDIEIICVNDGSTDGSAAILAEYAAHDKRIKVITQENRYIGAARNRGIEAARGEYVGFMDQDDWVSLNYFEDLYNAAKKYNTDVAIAEQVYAIREKNTKLPLNHLLGKTAEAFDTVGAGLYRPRRYIWEKIYRRDFLNRHQIRFPTLRALYEDYNFMVQVLLYAKKIAVAYSGVYYYFMDSVSTSRYAVRINWKGEEISERRFTLDTPQMQMFKETDALVEAADVDETHRQRMRQYCAIYRQKYFTNFNSLLAPEERPLWQKMCQEAYPGEKFDFEDDIFNDSRLLLF